MARGIGAAWLLGLGLAATCSAAETAYDCLIEPWMTVRLGAETQGVLQEVGVKRGDAVSKGQVVARLVSEVQEASLELAEARAANALPVEINRARAVFERTSLSRQDELYRKQLVSDQQIEESRIKTRLADLQTRESQVEQRLNALDVKRARALLRQKEIVSPLDGLVLVRDLVPGEYITEGESVMTLAQIDPLRVEGYLPLEMIGRVQVGDRLEIRPAEPVGGVYVGVVEAVDRVVDAASGTIGIGLRLDNPDQLTLAGVKCTLSTDPLAPQSLVQQPAETASLTD